MAKILIVDDEYDLCEAFARYFSEDGHGVDVAGNGMVALEKSSKNTYDIIFLDVLMPRMEGREVLEAIRKKSKTPVVIISGYLSPDKEKEALRLGAVACFHKPFDMKSIKKLVDQITEKKEV